MEEEQTFMDEQPGFFSAENFPYPLLALAQTIPRGYQYQSQMTPYARDAKGDWGRALNESIDQFFAMYPQFLQQKRAFALQREQLARQRADDAYKAKLRPYELKKLEAEAAATDRQAQMLQNYPQMIQGLPLGDKDKAFLSGLPPSEGLKLVSKYLENRMTKNKLVTLGVGDPNNPFNVPVQIDPQTNKITTPLGTTPQKILVDVDPNDPRLASFPKDQLPFLKLDMTYGGQGQIVTDPAYTTTMQKRDITQERPSASKRFQNWLAQGNTVQSFADLEPFAGKSPESQLWFATQNMPGTQLALDAQNQLNLKHIKSSPKGFIIGKGFKSPNNPQALQRLPQPTTEPIESGATLFKLAKKFGTTESQIIAANPLWFDKDENGNVIPQSMRTSAQMNNAQMTIPTGKSQLSPQQITDAHSSFRRNGVIEMPYGTIIPVQTATVSEGLKLNRERLDMQDIQTSLKDLIALMANPKARGFGKVGTKERGELEGLRQRLINNVQVLRDYGVLSPSEIENIERSVPDVNGFIALITQGIGSDAFAAGTLNKLYQEAINNERQVDAMIKLYNVRSTGYERYSGDIPGIEALVDTKTKNEVDSFRSE